MPKRTIDELIAAIEAVQVLQQTVAKHDQAIEKLIDKLDHVLRRLEALPGDSGTEFRRTLPNPDHAAPDQLKSDQIKPNRSDPEHGRD